MEKYVFYDESFIAPGYFILNTKNETVDKFLKFYNASSYSAPVFGIRAYSMNAKENPDDEFSSMDFSFSELKDDEKGLFNLFSELCSDLSGKRIFSMDSHAQGKNNLKLDSNAGVVKITLYKDTYHGIQHPCDFIDVLMGDEDTCNDYSSILKLWENLSGMDVETMSSDDVQKLLLIK